MKKWYEHVIPKDGVRAYVAIVAFTAVTAFASLETYVTHKAPEWYIGVVGIIIGHYFRMAKDSE